MTQVIFLLHDRSGYLIHVFPCSDDVMVKFQSWYQCHTKARFPKPGFLITTLWFIDLFSILLPWQMYGMKAFHNIVSAPSRKICMHLLLAGVVPEITILYAKRIYILYIYIYISIFFFKRISVYLRLLIITRVG